eukprot:4957819-Pyramimonas_sp.AAC.1
MASPSASGLSARAGEGLREQSGASGGGGVWRGKERSGAGAPASPESEPETSPSQSPKAYFRLLPTTG